MSVRMKKCLNICLPLSLDMEKQSVGETLHSFPSGLLPPLGASSHQPTHKKLRRYIISPYNTRYRWWQNFLIPLVMYSAWISTFETGFLQEPIPPALSILDNILNAFFAIDIALTFLVAYRDNRTYLLVDDPKKIALKYLSTWFIFDVSSTIPFQEFVLLFTGDPGSGLTYNLLHILRLWRLRKVSALFARLEKDIRVNYFWLRCVKLICTTLFSVHIAGCFFYLLASRYKDPKKTWIGSSISPDFREISIWERYVAAIYWSITTLSSVGYGDIHPQNTQEMIFDIVYMMFNLGLSSYLIGNMTSLVVEGSARTRKFRNVIIEASSCASRNQLPDVLKNQIIDYLSLKFRTEGYQKQRLFDSLPTGLRLNILQYLFLPILEKTYLFQGVSCSFLLHLVSEIQAVYFPARHDIILQEGAPMDLYIVVSGTVELVFRRGSEHEDKLVKEETGDVFGELGVLFNKPHEFRATTKMLSQLLIIGRSALLEVLESHVEDRLIVMANLSHEIPP